MDVSLTPIDTVASARLLNACALAECKHEGRCFSELPSVKVDLGTFNYGAALGVPKARNLNVAPWEDASAAREYEYNARFTRALADVSKTFSDAQWKMEMAIREVRNATTLSQQDAALRLLRRDRAAVEKSLNAITSQDKSVKWFRYGRIGDILARFNPFQHVA